MNILLTTSDDTIVFSFQEDLGTEPQMAVLHKEVTLFFGGNKYRIGWRGDVPNVTSDKGTAVWFYRDGGDFIGWADSSTGSYKSFPVNRHLHPALGVAFAAAQVIHATTRPS